MQAPCSGGSWVNWNCCFWESSAFLSFCLSHSVRIAGQLKCYLIQEAFHQTSTHSLRKFLYPPPLDMRSSFLGRNEALGVRRKPGLSPKGNGWNKQMWLKRRWHKVLGGGQSDQSGAGWEAGGLRRLQPQLLLWRASPRW